MVEKSPSGLWPNVYDPFRAFGQRVADWLTPASDASSGKDGYTIEIELPGVPEDAIDVTVQDGVVTVKGEKTSKREETGEDWYFSERQFGSFTRSFRLPADAKHDAVQADLKDGVLTLKVPRTDPKAPEATKVKIQQR
jgi:HSP20 family protein